MDIIQKMQLDWSLCIIQVLAILWAEVIYMSEISSATPM